VKTLLCLVPLYLLPLLVKSDVVLTILIFTFVLSILAVGFNIVFGGAGQLTMFHAAAFGIGSYVTFLSMLRFGISFWLWFTGLFTALSLGPFIHVAGVNTALPGPWTFLRYVPLVGMARAPSRFAIVAVLGLSILFGHAVEIWLRKTTWRARTGQFLFLAALVFELNPAPRHLFPADVPAVYSLISTDDELSSVLELPTGIRDGMSSIGDFSAESQFFQTKHRHRLVGGYLSRVSGSRKRENRRNPVMRMLTMLSEPSGTADPDLIARARESRNRFLSRTCVGYVVIHKRRASLELQAIAADVLQLVPIHDDADYELLRPVDPPACEPRRRGYRSARAELTTPPIE